LGGENYSFLLVVKTRKENGSFLFMVKCEEKDAKKEDGTIVNHFHGISSSGEARRNLSDRRIGVSGKFWNVNRGRIRDDETNTLFKCTVSGFHTLHKWTGGGVPSETVELQEMGVDGQVSTEPGGSNDDIIFFRFVMKYPLPFLQYCHFLRLHSLSFIKISW
jgi:hypothetical protein